MRPCFISAECATSLGPGSIDAAALFRRLLGFSMIASAFAQHLLFFFLRWAFFYRSSPGKCFPLPMHGAESIFLFFFPPLTINRTVGLSLDRSSGAHFSSSVLSMQDRSGVHVFLTALLGQEYQALGECTFFSNPSRSLCFDVVYSPPLPMSSPFFSFRLSRRVGSFPGCMPTFPFFLCLCNRWA